MNGEEYNKEVLFLYGCLMMISGAVGVIGGFFWADGENKAGAVIGGAFR